MTKSNSMRVLIVLAHPRKTSLTYQIKESFQKGLEDSGHQVDTLDLYEIKFNPVMYEEDEPDYDTETQNFSEEVYQEMERLLKYDAVAFAFPMYWNGMPAILKGYIDRVWNFNFAYGDSATFKPQRLLWLAVAGATPRQMAKHDLSQAIETVFNYGIASFCGFEKSKFKIFFESTTTNANVQNHIPEAYQEALDFEEW